MFEQLTDDATEEELHGLEVLLSKESSAARSAVARFFAAIRDDPTTDTYAAAYRVLADAFRDLSLLNSALVGDAWMPAEARRRPDGLRNPKLPDRPGDWAQAEYLLDHVDQPVPIAKLQEIQRPGWGKISGPATADLVVAVANANLGRLAPAKARVGGRVAYLVRSSDETPAGGRDRWSSYSLPELVAT